MFSLNEINAHFDADIRHIVDNIRLLHRNEFETYIVRSMGNKYLREDKLEAYENTAV